MTIKIKKILDELYLIDPELKNHEQILEKLIGELLKVKPDTQFDLKFARELKEKIMGMEVEVQKENFKSSNLLFSLPMKRMIMALSGTALALVLVLTVLTTGGQLTQEENGLGLQKGQSFSRVKNAAFGSLLATADGRGSAAESAVSAPLGLGGGSNAAAPSIATGRGGGGIGVADAKMIAPYPYINYKYVYKGEPLELKDSSVDVYKRISPQTDTSDMVGVLSRLGFGGLNLGSFTGANLSNFELVQKTKDGYIVNINVGEGMISVNQNWPMWTDCVNGRECPAPAPLQMSNLPADEQIISIADQFLKDLNIELSNYGKGEVENEWKRMYTIQSPEMMPQYVPESIQVVYPLLVQGSTVYEMGGNKKGIRVTVDVRKNKVSGAWQIMSQDYEVSSYAGETDWTRIQKIAENGGVYGGPAYYEKDANVKEVEVELGTPERILTTVWNNQGEIIVPGIRFTVKAPAENPYFWPTSITVPLAKEILDNYSFPGPIRIMDAVPTGSAEGGASATVESAKPTPITAPDAR